MENKGFSFEKIALSSKPQIMQFLPCFWARHRNSRECVPHVQLDYFRSTNHVVDLLILDEMLWLVELGNMILPRVRCTFLVHFSVVLYKKARENKKIRLFDDNVVTSYNLAFHFFASRLFTTFQSYDTSHGILFDVNKIEWSPIYKVWKADFWFEVLVTSCSRRPYYLLNFSHFSMRER